MLQQFLPSVIKYTPDDIADVIVADNASTDKSMDVLKEQFPSVKTLVLDKNYGIAGGNIEESGTKAVCSYYENSFEDILKIIKG